MDIAIAAALGATMGFAAGDVFTALLARKVSGKASMVLLTLLKLAIYAPFALFIHSQFAQIDGYVLAWSALLGVLFFIAYWGFNMGLAVGKNPALVGVVAGCFPASAAFVAIVFLGHRPSALVIGLLVAVLTGVTLLGLPDDWRKSLRLEKGILLALLPMLCWGIFGALLHKPVQHLDTPEGWFVVQTLVAVVMVVGVLVLYNRQIPALATDTMKKKAWVLVLLAGVIIGAAEAAQALALGHGGKDLVIIEALLGGYPAVYFLIAHKIFHVPLRARQWAGIAIVAISIMLLSMQGVSA